MFVGSMVAIDNLDTGSEPGPACRQRVFKKKSGFKITINRRRLAATAAPPPPVAGSANSIFLQHRHRRLADADVPTGSDVADF